MCASSSNRRTQHIVKVTAVTLQWSRARWTCTIMVKKYVMGSQKNDIQWKIGNCTKKNLGYAAGTTVALGLSESFWFLPVPGLLWVPRRPVPVVCICLWVLLRICWFLNLLRIQHNKCLCRFRVLVSREHRVHYCAGHSVRNRVFSAPCQQSKFLPVRQTLFGGALAPTLLPVRPGPHWRVWACHHPSSQTWGIELNDTTSRYAVFLTMENVTSSRLSYWREVRRRQSQDWTSRRVTNIVRHYGKDWSLSEESRTSNSVAVMSEEIGSKDEEILPGTGKDDDVAEVRESGRTCNTSRKKYAQWWRFRHEKVRKDEQYEMEYVRER